MVNPTDSVSRADLDHLKKELLELRKAAGLPEPVKDQQHPKEVYASATLIESMDRLHGVLDKLVKLFENANKEVYDEYSKGMHDTDTKLNQLIAQNEKIARGIVALADLAKKPAAAPVVAPSPAVNAQPQNTGAAQPAPKDDDIPIPAPPRFEVASQPDVPVQSGWQPPVAGRAPPIDEESFMRQPVISINPSMQPQSPPPPAVTRPVLPSLAPLPTLAPLPSPMSSPPPQQPVQTPQGPSMPITPPQGASSWEGSTLPRPGMSDLPPPPAPPASNPGRRSILEKFSFK